MSVYPPPMTSEAGDGVLPFSVGVPDAALDDLAARLSNIRWPEAETVDDDSQGVPLADMQALVEQWRDRHDWRAVEKHLNRWPHFRTRIDGLGIHFLHVRSRHEAARPLIMTHGWPGSIVEFMEVIGPLTDPTAHGGGEEDAFHLVLPSLPGYGFSDKPDAPGWNHVRTARAWATLMQRLGYDRYYAQGGDWGAVVTRQMAHERVEGLAGVHLNFVMVEPPEDADMTTPQAREWAEALEYYAQWGNGYAVEQSTRPQTLGYALADSPVGQAAWIYEKFREWTDHDGAVESVVPLSWILDNIALYWFTNSAASSGRYYWESFRSAFATSKVDLPVGCSLFPGEISRPPREWADSALSNIVHWNKLDKGGHFAAMEQPELFVSELRAAFAAMR